MAKQKAKPKGSRKRMEGQAPVQDTKPNLFERLYNRKKFDVLGKKVKGERKHGQSVHDAVEKVSITSIAAAVCTAAQFLQWASQLTPHVCCCLAWGSGNASEQSSLK